jgi:hypothetical protein
LSSATIERSVLTFAKRLVFERPALAVLILDIVHRDRGDSPRNDDLDPLDLGKDLTPGINRGGLVFDRIHIEFRAQIARLGTIGPGVAATTQHL